MKTIIFYISILFLPFAITAQDDLSVIKSRILKEIFDKSNDVQLTKAVLTFKNINSDGSWPEINYDDNSASNWLPIKHLERLQMLASAFAKPNNVYKGNDEIYQTIVKGLHFWYVKNPRSTNWWQNDIATTQYLGRVLLLMSASERNITEDLQKVLIGRMQTAQGPFTFTGANKLDIAIAYIYRALITNNDKLMNIAVMEAFQPIEFTTAEGLQHDYSYQQHKEQLMISAYGYVFLTGEYQVAAWLAGTKYALDNQKLTSLNNYFFNTYSNALRGGYMDYNLEGRGISRPKALDKTRIADGGLFKDILQTDKTKKEALNIIADRVTGKKSASFDVKPLHIYFWKGDYTLHVRPKYSFNVRTVSKRTVRTESGNKENLLGTVLPDGSVNLVRRGNEYLNIMPVWEWDKIPGVTARDYDTAVILKKQWGEYGSTDFVGGVTDSLYGATVYEQDYDNVKVKKAYFFFDNEIVCLGAGIKSNAPQNITTTINQAWNNGKVLTSSNNKTFQLKKQSEFSDLNWVWHDSIGYYFPKPQNVFVSSQQQSGSWTSINGNQKGTEKGMVFKMWIDHGRNPVSASYEYIVVPGISEKEASSNNIDGTAILSNNESLQAVAQKDLKIIQAVFYTPGELSWQGIKIKADKPCILQIRDFDKSTVKLSIADPAQKLEDVTITINTPELKEKKLTIGLPKAPYGGQSVALEIK